MSERGRFAPIPPQATGLELDRWCCGDDCYCNAMKIYATWPADLSKIPEQNRKFHSDKARQQLWEGDWFWPSGVYKDDPIEGIKEEAEEACRHYGWEVSLSGDYCDWEAEKQL
jgi:hypothetical protein